jgi:putative Mn2+ efflux pump MntP
LVALLLPLSLDTFVIAAALGMAGLPPLRRLRVSLVLVGFEAGMPLIGVGVGQALGHAVGSMADYLASAALLILGALMLFGGDDGEADTAAMLARSRGLAMVALGISISVDELAIGFSVGLLRLPLAWAIVLIASQALRGAAWFATRSARWRARPRTHRTSRRLRPDCARHRLPGRDDRVSRWQHGKLRFHPSCRALEPQPLQRVVERDERSLEACAAQEPHGRRVELLWILARDQDEQGCCLVEVDMRQV